MSKRISTAQTRYWFVLHLSGLSFRKIAKQTGHDREVIAKHVKALEELMAVDETLLRELVPLAIELLKTVLMRQTADIRAGKRFDFTVVDRLLTGMKILDSRCSEAGATGQ